MPVGGKYESCCVVVRNMQRSVYAVPSPSIFPPSTLSELEQLESSEQPDDKETLKAKIQVRITLRQLSRRCDLDSCFLERVRERHELFTFVMSQSSQFSYLGL